MSKVAKNARFKDYNGCVEWLEMAGMVNVMPMPFFSRTAVEGELRREQIQALFWRYGLVHRDAR